MDHPARFGRAFRRGNAPFSGRCIDQDLSGLRTHHFEGVPVAHYRERRDGILDAAEFRIAVELVVRRRRFDRDPVPVGIHVFGDDQRQTGHDALPHFRGRRHDRNRIVGPDGDIGVDGVVAVAARCRSRLTDQTGDGHGKGESRRAADESPPADLEFGKLDLADVVHDLASFAARCTARTMRGYVPQRQIFEFMCCTISSRDGCLFVASSSAAFMIWPDWQ